MGEHLSVELNWVYTTKHKRSPGFSAAWACQSEQAAFVCAGTAGAFLRAASRCAPGRGCPGRQGSHTQSGGKRRKQSGSSGVVNGMNWSTRFLGNAWLPGRITWKDLQYLHIKGADIGCTGSFKRKPRLSPRVPALTQDRLQRHCRESCTSKQKSGVAYD